MSADGAGASRRWTWWAGLVAGVLLGLVLIYSAWGKALDPVGVGQIFVRKGLMPGSFATPIIVVGVAVEAALGLALLSGFRRPLILAGATVLMAGFFGLTMYEYFVPSKDASSCGCFGNLIVRTPGQAVIGDGAFLVLALLAWLGRPRGAFRAARWVAPALGALAGAGLALAAPHLPLDDWATRLKPGARTAELRLDDLLPELQRGRHLVLLVDRADEKTRGEIGRVNRELALKASKTPVLGLAEENEQLAMEFTWTAAPAFDVRSAPFMILKPLYRTLPRAFLVQDGVVVKVWNSIPPDDALKRLAEGATP